MGDTVAGCEGDFVSGFISETVEVTEVSGASMRGEVAATGGAAEGVGANAPIVAAVVGWALIVTGAGAGFGGRPTLAPLTITAVLLAATGAGSGRARGKAPRFTGTPAAQSRATAEKSP